MNVSEIKKHIVDVPDFPKPGIVFKDLTPLFLNPAVVKDVVRRLAEPYRNSGTTKVIGVESRGFLLGVMLAQELNAAFVVCRKPGKLPREVISQSYELEYGTDTLEIHREDIQAKDVILIHDDVLATGGTAQAVGKIVANTGAKVAGYSFICELEFLKGIKKLAGAKVDALVCY